MVTKCCCFLNLRTGMVLLAIFGLAGSLATMACIPGWEKYEYYEYDWDLSASLPICIFGIISYGPLLIGAIIRKHEAILIFLVMYALNLIALLSLSIFLFTKSDSYILHLDHIMQHDLIRKLRRDINVLGSAYIINAVIGMYFWICAHSFWKELRSTGSSNSCNDTV